MRYLAGAQQDAETKVVDAAVVAHDGEILGAGVLDGLYDASDEGGTGLRKYRDEVLRNTAEAETTNKELGPRADICNGILRRGVDLQAPRGKRRSS